jgi:hypothetical protein
MSPEVSAAWQKAGGRCFRLALLRNRNGMLRVHIWCDFKGLNNESGLDSMQSKADHQMSNLLPPGISWTSSSLQNGNKSSLRDSLPVAPTR